jgi:hypothetical protein
MTIDKIVHEKIQKILELARRGGTEAEADTAMRKALELLAKHNLSMADISAQDEREQLNEKWIDAKRAYWHRYIWSGIAKLYFCTYFRQSWLDQMGKRKMRHVIVGRESNVSTVKEIAQYLIALGDELAKGTGGDTIFRNSFKAGYASRISQRARQQVREAKERLIDSDTGSNLPVANLYALTTQENEHFLKRRGIVLEYSRYAPSYGDGDGYRAGQAAGQSVSLSSAARGRIAHK